MSKRDEYIQKIEAAIDELKVKRSLAKLEARELRGELTAKYDKLRDLLRALKEDGGDNWRGLKGGVEAAWKEFHRAFDAAKHKQPG